jgi:hypothetical protein
MINKIDEIIKYNKEKNKYMSKIINLKKKYKIAFNKTKDNKILELYSDNSRILVGTYNFYGIYQKSTKLWIWATSIPGISKKYIDIINKLKSYNYIFESSNDPRMNFYYQLLTQDIIYISDNNLLTWINELLLYLSQDISYFNPLNSEGNIQFIGLSKIIEKFY